MHKTSFPFAANSFILSQWVIGKTREEIIEMPERFRELISEMDDDEDIYGELIRLKVEENYLFCHFRHDSQVCTKSILELYEPQLTPCREYCVRSYSLAAQEKWVNTEYEVIIQIVYGVAPGGYVECQPLTGYKVGFRERLRSFLGK